MSSLRVPNVWSLQFALLLSLTACDPSEGGKDGDDGGDSGAPALDAASDARTAQPGDADGDGKRDASGELAPLFDAAPDASPLELDATASGPPEADAAADGQVASEADAAVDASDGATCTPSLERCNQRDDDCDGIVDNGCVDGLTLHDFDVTASGAVVAVGSRSGGHPHLLCLNADGTMVRAPTLLAMPEADQLNKADGSRPSLARVDVARARVASNVAVSWMYYNWPNPQHDWRVYAAFYDAQCNRVREPAALDAELPNAPGATPATAPQIAREATVFMSDDGRSYFLYEHQSAAKFRALVFDAAGVRSAAVTINPSNECGIGARTRVLALEAKSGKFAVACESNADNSRILRRYQADGVPIDGSFVVVPGSKPTFAFHYFGLGWNASESLLYYGRVDATRWILRAWSGAGELSEREVVGSSGSGNPRTRVTSRGDFLIELPTSGHPLALVSPTGDVLRTFPNAPSMFELDGQDRFWVNKDGRVYPDPEVVLYP